jgi:hypothetical protein
MNKPESHFCDFFTLFLLVFVKLKNNWEIDLIHDTHLDIGYTQTQDEVLERQFEHLETAMDLIEANRNRSSARFRWNPEATWASLMRQIGRYEAKSLP